MKKWLFNPFVYLAGARSLFIGLGIMVLTALIGYYSNTRFDGVIDIHNAHHAPVSLYLLQQLIALGCTVPVFYAAGLMFSQSSIRFIDVAGTMSLARWPMLFPAIIGFGIKAPENMKTVDDIVKSITGTVIALSILELVFVIWMVALMYNAFCVSCNMKGGKATGVFIAGLVLAEIISLAIKHLIR